MTIQDQEKIRILELLLILGGWGVFACTGDDTIRQLSDIPFLLDLNTSYRSITLTEEYKELKKIYNEVIKNVSQFMKKSNIESPVEIFAMYIYMYRSGFLSYQKDFQFSDMHLLDFSKMHGLDVVLGKGCCRSIACMLDDIYHCYGFDSSILLVQANASNISSYMTLSDVPLKDSEEVECSSNVLDNLLSYVVFPNHVINVVSDEKNSMILDPTLDGMLYGDNARRLSVANAPDIKMKNFPFILGFESKILARLKSENRIYSFLKKDSISHEEYRKIYLDTLKICKNNLELMQMFYQDNCSLYNEIYNIGSNCDEHLRRMLPILSKKKR